VRPSFREGRLTRRHAVGWLGLGALGLLSGWNRAARAAGSVSQVGQTRARAVTFPKGAIIRTLLKDLPPEALAGGPLLFHEHLSLHTPVIPVQFTDDVDLIVEEVRAAGRDGISCIVDGGHPDMSRSLDALKRIANESGVSIVASGGYYTDRPYPPEIAANTADQIADDLVREALEQRLGAFGEIGQKDGVMTERERKVFLAIGKAQARTGLPVFTHNAYMGTMAGALMVPRDAALRQLDRLEEGGGNPAHIAIGHVCCLDDPKADIAIQLARRRAFVGFDRATSPTVRVPDAQKATTILAMVDAGCADHVLISSDFSHAEDLKKHGGPGFAKAATVFGPMLRKAGLSETILRAILVDNPRRFLAFVPKSG
jgi:phosphotriesterase-related protein